MSNKFERQNKIKEFLNSMNITSQEELVSLFGAEGVQVTQATLSRDFAELGVVRTVTENGTRYVLDPNESGRKVRQLISFEILNVEHNESLVIVRTLAGRAQGVGHYIDKLNKKEILGTVAGDDTILIIPDSVKNVAAIVKIIKSIMVDVGDDGHD